MYYISIALMIIFASLIVNHLINHYKNNTFEGLENKVSSKDINELFLSTNNLKTLIKEYQNKNDELNSQLDSLEKKLIVKMPKTILIAMQPNQNIQSLKTNKIMHKISH